MNKYKNQETTVDGIKFDSKREAARYAELILLLRAGKIRNLKLQPQFTLQESFKTPQGERVRAVVYIADFSYERATEPDASGTVHWIPVVEDTKGVRTQAYKLKKRLMQGKFGVEVQEI